MSSYRLRDTPCRKRRRWQREQEEELAKKRKTGGFIAEVVETKSRKFQDVVKGLVETAPEDEIFWDIQRGRAWQPLDKRYVFLLSSRSAVIILQRRPADCAVAVQVDRKSVV